MANILPTPRVLTKDHIKSRVLYCPPKKALAEGIVDELSPSGENVRISGKWLENQSGLVVEMLPDLPKETPKPKRHSPSKR